MPKPTSIWLKADKIGTYEGQCAEYCGAQHAHMRFLVIVQSRADFNAWQVAARRPAPEPVFANEKHGKAVFLGGTCVMCHSIAGTPAGAGLGPDLTHVASRLALGAGTIPNNPGHLAGWIIDPQRINFVDLRQWVIELDGFDDDPSHSGEKILEAIQAHWIDESDFDDED